MQAANFQQQVLLVLVLQDLCLQNAQGISKFKAKSCTCGKVVQKQHPATHPKQQMLDDLAL